MRKWIKIDTIVQVVALAASAVGLFTGLKAAAEESEDLDAKIDRRVQEGYGLLPINEEESE